MNSPKHEEFYSKNEFEKLVHLVGFVIGICHDARSPERQKDSSLCIVLLLPTSNISTLSKCLVLFLYRMYETYA